MDVYRRPPAKAAPTEPPLRAACDWSCLIPLTVVSALRCGVAICTAEHWGTEPTLALLALAGCVLVGRGRPEAR